MTKLHRLLKRQLKRELGTDVVPESLRDFILSVNSAYHEFENEKGLMERSIEISSREYNERTTQLEKTEEYLTSLVETIPLGIINIDCEGKILLANSAAERIFGLSREDIVGKIYSSILQGQPSKGFTKISEDSPINVSLLTGSHVSGIEYVITCPDNSKRVLNVNTVPLYDSQGNFTGIVASLEDITIRKKMEEQLKYLSLHDSLTGLYNRAYFEEEMRRMSSGQYNPVGIIIIDIDGLKLINDTVGHEQGDILLQKAASIFKGCLNKKEVLARIGGDEFAILLSYCSKKKLDNTCQKIRRVIQIFNEEKESIIPLSISMGVAISNETKLHELYKVADNNMYREKLHHHQSTRSTIVETLMKALEARDFITEGHAARMRDLIKLMAEAVGLSKQNIADIILLAQFHDIGKVGIPDRILFKPIALTPKETTEMHRHCEIGHRIAQSSPDLMVIADWILKHHEWWNGKGYPLGLKGEDIPLECRILALVDAYDAMTSNRPYRNALTHEEAIAEIIRCKGTQFDPKLVDKFLQIFDSEDFNISINI